MSDSPLMKKLRQKAASVGARAARELAGSRSDPLGSAVRGVQETRRVVDDNTARMLGAVGVATRDDLERVTRRIGRLRKRLQEIVDDLE